MAEKIPKEVRLALAIPEHVHLERIARIEAPAAPAAEGAGDAVLATLSLLRLLEGPISESPDAFEELAVPSEMQAAGITRLRWYDHAPILQIAGPGLAAAKYFGSVESQGPNVTVIDARTATAFAFIPGRSEIVVAVDATGVEAHGSKPAEIEGVLGTWQAPPPIHIDPPPLPALLGALPCEPWLAEAYQRLVALGVTWSSVVAVGLVGRLWAPPASDAGGNVELARVLAEPGPAERSRRWFAALPREVREAVELATRDEAHGLRDDLSFLAATLDGPSTRAMALSWLHRRDDLESVAFLGQFPDLDDLLLSVDHAAADHNSIWSCLGPFDDDVRLSAVSWQEPHAWWGGLATG